MYRKDKTVNINSKLADQKSVTSHITPKVNVQDIQMFSDGDSIISVSIWLT